MKKLNEENYVGEIWKDIKGYEGLYQVSNLGRVRSLENNKKRKEKILKHVLNNRGYQHVALCKNGKVKKCYVHRLVYETFNGKIPKGYEINHISEDKTENSLSNLNLLSHKANLNWGTRNERAGKAISKAKSKPVIQKTLQGEIIKIWPSANEIQRQLGYNKGSICSCCRGGYFQKGKWVNCTKAYGYIWEYEEANTN